MRLLSIGTDRKLFEDGSLVRERQTAYAEKIGEIDTIVFTKKGFEPFRFGTLSVTPTNSSSRWFYGMDAWKIAKRLPKSDAITTQDPFETGLVALFIAWRLKVPLHVQVHTDFTSKEFVRHSFLNWLRRRIAWFVLKRAKRIRVILQRTADDIRAGGITAPITVLPIFVDAARFASLPRTKHPRWKVALLAVGRFEKEKRFELAIDALALARAKGHDIGLTMVGEGNERQTYYRHAQRLRVADRLDIVGWHNDLARFYSEADVVLVPSRYEGYGLVIVEALSAGIPVIATDVGVAREAGAIVVSAKEFPQAVLRWIESGPRTGALSPQPYKGIEDYVNQYCADIAATAPRVV
jgi:glycosyltransferase involved in cell wall biosynthesis